MKNKTGNTVLIVGWILGMVGEGFLTFAAEPATVKGSHFFMEAKEGDRLTWRQECWVAGDQFRVVFHRGYPKRSYILFDGSSVWQWKEGETEAKKQSPKFAAQWRGWTSRYRPEYGELKQEGPEEFGGVLCERQSFMSLPDVNGPSSVIREWIDPKISLVLKREMDEDPQLKTTVLLTKFESGIVIDSAMFKLPEGVKAPPPTPLVGQPAPDFSLKRYDTGEALTLSQFKGKNVVLLNFFATWCGPCVAEMPGFVKVYQAYKEKGVEFLSVDVGERDGDPKGLIARFAREEGVTWPILLDDASQISHRVYGARQVPTTVVINTEGIIEVYKVGKLTEEKLAQHLDRILGLDPKKSAERPKNSQ